MWICASVSQKELYKRGLGPENIVKEFHPQKYTIQLNNLSLSLKLCQQGLAQYESQKGIKLVKKYLEISSIQHADTDLRNLWTE